MVLYICKQTQGDVYRVLNVYLSTNQKRCSLVYEIVC